MIKGPNGRDVVIPKEKRDHVKHHVSVNIDPCASHFGA
jgi:hypothetical protein